MPKRQQAPPFASEDRQAHIAAFDEQIASSISAQHHRRHQKDSQDELDDGASDEYRSRPGGPKQHRGHRKGKNDDRHR
jgi:hypothetical protein